MSAAPDAAKPVRKFHFISGLPRAGSTLLAAILKQNPRFRAGMTSPLADIMGVVIAEASSKNDFSFAVSDDQRVSLLRGLVENFYAGPAGAEVTFDTSRLWYAPIKSPRSASGIAARYFSHASGYNMSQPRW